MSADLIAAGERMDAAERKMKDVAGRLDQATHALDAARDRVDAPRAGDDAEELLATLDKAEGEVRHFAILRDVSERTYLAAREGHMEAHRRSMDAAHEAAVQAKIEAAEAADKALADLEAANEAAATAHRQMESLYARGYARTCDGALLHHRRTADVLVRTAADERAFWQQDWS